MSISHYQDLLIPLLPFLGFSPGLLANCSGTSTLQDSLRLTKSG